MWIRSQDKCILLNLDSVTLNIFPGNVKSIIVAFDNNKSCYELAVYSSEEKALKVLDMIQGCVTGNKLTNNNYEIFRDCQASGLEFHGIFKMPQDDEVKV